MLSFSFRVTIVLDFTFDFCAISNTKKGTESGFEAPATLLLLVTKPISNYIVISISHV